MRLYKLAYLSFLVTFILGVLFDEDFNRSTVKWIQCGLVAVIVIIQILGFIK